MIHAVVDLHARESEILGCNHAVDGRFRVRLRFGRDFRAVSDTFGEHKVHVGDADEAEEGGQVWGLIFHSSRFLREESFTFSRSVNTPPRLRRHLLDDSRRR